MKGDIVEALKVLKRLLHKGLIFCHVVFTADIEKELDDLEDCINDMQTYFDVVNEAEAFSWDQLVEDDEYDGTDDSTGKFVTELD